MHNDLGRHKPTRPRIALAVSSSMRKPINVKDLIQKAPLLKKEAAQFFDAERQWRDFLGARLPDDLAARIAAVGSHPPQLTIYAESAAWSARLKYALAELEAAIRIQDPAIQSVVVKVKPAAGAAARKGSARDRS
jgi:hypothetical protein